MTNLYIMVGPPGCGKSTYISEHMNLTNDRWISRDQIRFNTLKTNDDYFKREKEVYREYVQRIQANLDEGYNVWADATHLNERSRMKLLNNLNLTGINVTFIQFQIPLEVCLERNAHRTGRACVPKKELKKMFQRQTDVSKDKSHFYKVFTVRG